MRRGIAASALVAVAVAAAPAHAQGGSLFAFGSPGLKPISETEVPTAVTGQLVVSFHGDPVSGCARSGLCAYSGTVIVRPSASGGLAILKYRRHRKLGYLAAIDLSGPNSITASRMQRAPAGRQLGRCADAQSRLGPSNLPVRNGALTFELLQDGGSLLATRCGGPLDGDVRTAGPRVTMPVPAVLRGHALIDLRGVRPFAAHGFAGTVTSTIRIQLGRPRRESASLTSPPPPPLKLHRTRLVTEKLTLIRMGGGVSVSLRGASDPDICSLLDTCGESGTLQLRPTPTHVVDAELTATGPANRPYADFLAALGLRHTGRTDGILVGGVIDWRDRGLVEANLGQPQRCSDTDPLDEGYVTLMPGRRSLDASYGPQASVRKRCPGPLLAPGSASLSGPVSRSDLGKRTFTITMRRAVPFEDDGYAGRVRGALSLVLHRGPARSQFIETPGP